MALGVNGKADMASLRSTEQEDGWGFWAPEAAPSPLRKAGVLHPRHLVSGEYLFREGVPTF